MTKIAIIFFQYSNLMFVLYNLLAHNLTLILCVEWTLNNVHIYMCNNNGWFVDSLIRSFFLFFLHWYLRRFCLSKDLWTLHFIERKNQFNVCMYVCIYCIIWCTIGKGAPWLTRMYSALEYFLVIFCLIEMVMPPNNHTMWWR